MKILITGANSGIAFLESCVLIGRGHDVIMGVKTNKEKENLSVKLKKLNLKADIMVINLLKKEDLEKVSDLDIDVLHLHAGVGFAGKLRDIDEKVFKENFEVNVFGNLSLIQNFLRRENPIKRVVVTSSLLANKTMPYFGSYILTKTTIEKMIKILRLENIFNETKFVLVKPGAYHTGFNQYMIESGVKSAMSEKEIKSLKTLFNILEHDNLNSIVYKMVRAIELGDCYTYSAPLCQAFLSSLIDKIDFLLPI